MTNSHKKKAKFVDHNYRHPSGLLPGMLSMRWPGLAALFWQHGRSIDSSRAAGATIWNTEKDPIKIAFYRDN